MSLKLRAKRGGLIALAVVAAALMAPWANSTDVRTQPAAGMDLILRQVVAGSAKSTASSWSKAVVAEGDVRLIPCLLRTRDVHATREAIEDVNGEVRSEIDQQTGTTILSAHIPVQVLQQIAARPEILAMEYAAPLRSKMDTARTATRVNLVQDGSVIGTPYTGLNVVVGAVDDGLDYGNDDFTRTGNVTRVQYVRQATSSGVAECTHSTIVSGQCENVIADYGQGTAHGTHVMGIAAGSNSTYTGVASAADIMFSFDSATDADSSGTFATSVIDGVTAMFGKADIMDKPAVVNLSLGTSLGAHDGTSLLEQGLDALVAGKRGRIIVNAAGNEQVAAIEQPVARRDYVGGIHATMNVPAGESRGYRVAVWDGRRAAAAFTGGTVVDTWLDTGKKDNCSIAVLGYTQGRAAQDFTFPGLATTDNASLSTTNVPFGSDTVAPVTATSGSVDASIEVQSVDPRNQKAHATVLLSPTGSSISSALEQMWYDVVVRAGSGGDCTGHMWLYMDYVAFHDFLKKMAGMGHDVAAGATYAGYTLADGDSQYTTTIPATAINVLAAGSYMPEKPIGAGVSQWTADDGNTYLQSDVTAPGGTGSVTNDLSDFSSLGPTADGRIKPDVVTPGEPIISTKARGAYEPNTITVGGTHFKSAGTSMASPHLTGIVALLLTRNNTLTVDQVRAAVQTGATTTGMTPMSPDPANSYGAGKVDAVAILQSVAEDTSAYHGTGDLDGGGGSSCELAPGAGPISAKTAIAGFSMVCGLLFLCARWARRMGS